MQPLGYRHARIDGVYTDAVLAQRCRPSGCDQHQRRVGGPARQMHRRGGLSAHSDDVDDGTAFALDHSRPDRIHCVNVGKVFGIHALLPGFVIELLPKEAAGRSCAVDKNIGWAQEFLGLLHGRFGVFHPSEISTHSDNFQSFVRQILPGLFEVCFAARCDRHARTFAGKCAGARQANSFTASGYDDDFAF